MHENELLRKCAGALLGVAVAVALAVFVSWWLAAPPADLTAAPAKPARQAPAVAPPPPTAPAAARTPAAPVVSQPTPAQPTSADETEQLAKKAFRLEMENARLRHRLDDMLNWLLDNVRGTFPLPETQMANLRVTPVDDHLQVSADLAQILRLNDAEVDTLDQAFWGTRTLLYELETEKLTVDEPAAGQAVLNMPPYPEEGQVVREELYNTLQRTLGVARFQRFRQVAETGLDEQFEYFGEVERTIEFAEVADAASGHSQLFVRDERILPNREDPQRQDITTSERLVTELPAEYYAYWNWLPDYVTRFARGN